MKKSIWHLILLCSIFSYYLTSCGQSNSQMEGSFNENFDKIETTNNSANIEEGTPKNKLQQYLYKLSLVVNETDSISEKVKIKGSNTNTLTVDVSAKKYSEGDNEVTKKGNNYAEDTRIVDGKHEKIIVKIFASDESIKFSKGDKLFSSIIDSATIPYIDNKQRRVLRTEHSFVIDEKHKNRNKKTSIKAEVFLENSSETIQSQTLELEIVPLTFGEKLQNFYIDAQDETINKMNVLYTALLGIIVSAIITFVRRKLQVNNE